MNLKVSYPQHESMLISSFNTYYEQEDYLDLIFICEKNIKVKAHKIVVAAVSDLIKEMLQSTNDDIVFISLPDVSHKNMKLLLNYLYEGLARVSQTELAELKTVLILLKIQLPFANVTTITSAPNSGPTTENSLSNIKIKISESDEKYSESNNAICVATVSDNTVTAMENISAPGPSKCAVAPFRASRPPPALPISEMYDVPPVSKSNISSVEGQHVAEQNSNTEFQMAMDSSSDVSQLHNNFNQSNINTGVVSSQQKVSATNSTNTESPFNVVTTQNSLMFGGLSQNFFINAPQAAGTFAIQQNLQFHASNLNENQQTPVTENVNGSDKPAHDVIVIEDDDDDDCDMNTPSTSTVGGNTDDNSTVQTGLLRPNPFNKAKILRCCKCAKIIGSSLRPVEPTRFLVCGSCKSSTNQNTVAALTERLQQTSREERVYQCSDCSVKFDKFLDLLAHSVAHKKVFKCKLCDQATFVNPLLLRQHMRQHGFNFM